MTAEEIRFEIARLAGLLAREVGNAEAQVTVERIGRRIGLRPPERPSMAVILNDLAKERGVSAKSIRSGGRKGPIAAARIAAYGAMTRCGYSQSEIARFLHRSPSTVNKALADKTAEAA